MKLNLNLQVPYFSQAFENWGKIKMYPVFLCFCTGSFQEVVKIEGLSKKKTPPKLESLELLVQYTGLI